MDELRMVCSHPPAEYFEGGGGDNEGTSCASTPFVIAGKDVPAVMLSS
jgi:hypothetical protein